jgi:alkylated DNA repair dioxygenase AlkB
MDYYLQTEKSFLGHVKFEDEKLLEQCVNDIVGKLEIKPPVYIFGRICKQQRNIGFFSDVSIGYRYSGNISKSKPLTKSLKDLLCFVNTTLQADFNGILVNEYPDGNHYIGKHSDDEKALSKIGVVSISYGASRVFRIRDKTSGKIMLDIPTRSDELLIMGGDFQREFTHEVPKSLKIKNSRISFTFRKHLE